MIERHPEFAEDLGSNSKLVKYPHFESGICKLQTNRESELTLGEANAISHLKNATISNESEGSDLSEPVEEDPAEIILGEVKSLKKYSSVTES